MLSLRVTPAVAGEQCRLQRENTLTKGENYNGGKISFHTRRENRVRNHTIKGLALAAGAFLALALSAQANAATLRRATAGPAAVTGSEPGEVLWTYYETTYPFSACPTGTTHGSTILGGCNHGGNGDNIIRLINPNGSPSPAAGGGTEVPVCANIYVFDDDEEMDACCSCPISSAGLLTLSVLSNLTSNLVIQGNPDEGKLGAIAIVATAQAAGATAGTFAPCNPENFGAVGTDNLLGSITHNQSVYANGGGTTSGLTEIGLFDDAAGDATNLTYLQAECAVLTGNGSGAGVCTCPVEGSPAS
jgi:hypothetical protein